MMLLSKRWIASILVLILLSGFALTSFAGGEDVPASTQTQEEDNDWLFLDVLNETDAGISVPVQSAILMEARTGEVLFEQNADEQLPPASITKIMTLLLVMEALDAGTIHLEDMVSCSEHACSMGGSQIWLEPNETMSVHDLLKATAISSANDAAVALGEYIAGSEEAFVQMMNKRAQELSMTNTVFKNASGLDCEGHLSSARDIAIMSMELLKHEKITEYSTVWMDSLRNGATELVNTNKLIRFYKGATGLKTGTTDGAGSCLSASAEREDLSLVAVVMGAKTSNERFAGARTLLDYGFANFGYLKIDPPTQEFTPIKVLNGVETQVIPEAEPITSLLVNKQSENIVEQQVTLAQDLQAPVTKGQKIGEVKIFLNGEEVSSYPLIAAQEVLPMTFGRAFGMLWESFLRA